MKCSCRKQKHYARRLLYQHRSLFRCFLFEIHSILYFLRVGQGSDNSSPSWQPVHHVTCWCSCSCSASSVGVDIPLKNAGAMQLHFHMSAFLLQLYKCFIAPCMCAHACRCLTALSWLRGSQQLHHMDMYGSVFLLYIGITFNYQL